MVQKLSGKNFGPLRSTIASNVFETCTKLAHKFLHFIILG